MFSYEIKNGKVIIQKDGGCYFSIPEKDFHEFFVFIIEIYRTLIREPEKSS